MFSTSRVISVKQKLAAVLCGQPAALVNESVDSQK